MARVHALSEKIALLDPSRLEMLQHKVKALSIQLEPLIKAASHVPKEKEAGDGGLGSLRRAASERYAGGECGADRQPLLRSVGRQ